MLNDDDSSSHNIFDNLSKGEEPSTNDARDSHVKTVNNQTEAKEQIRVANSNVLFLFFQIIMLNC